ncbi:MAG: hypothetical protein PHH93_11385, partial [Prolixibacteraceae bacterium]|nr:hypothetical protein [Prolixibacteraceae bacterium]
MKRMKEMQSSPDKGGRRQFIKSTGMLLGTAALGGVNITSTAPVSKENVISGHSDEARINLIDIHTHTCLPRHPRVVRANGSHYPSPEGLIEVMDKAGITKAVVLTTLSPECRYTIVTPEETLEICNRYPDRLIPFCNFDPRYLTNSPKANFLPLL